MFFTFLACPVKHIELLWPRKYWSNFNAGPCFCSRKASFLSFKADKVQYLPLLKKQNKNLLVELDIISNDLSEVLSFHMSICSHRAYFLATLSLTSPKKEKSFIVLKLSQHKQKCENDLVWNWADFNFCFIRSDTFQFSVVEKYLGWRLNVKSSHPGAFT